MNHIPIFVPTRAHLPRMRTHQHLMAENLPFKFVVNTRQQAAELAALECDAEVLVTGLKPKKSDQPGYLLARKRQWIEELHPEGSLYAMCDDNIQALGMLDPDLWKNPVVAQPDANAVFRHPATFTRAFKELTDALTLTGLSYAGLTYRTSFMFMHSKYQFGSQVSSKVCVCRRSPLIGWQEYATLEDFHRTARCVNTEGAAVRLNWVYHTAPRYEAGGLGTLAERGEAPFADARRLAAEYPHLITTNDDGYPVFIRQGVNECRSRLKPALNQLDQAKLEVT